mmetsp:Transcript_42804/g.123733  ORF Transcript_42804/g.123733 Transcript_42804/m.123733 type:complete len:208 (-) Transcript_42804:306-929(-)
MVAVHVEDGVFPPGPPVPVLVDAHVAAVLGLPLVGHRRVRAIIPDEDFAKLQARNAEPGLEVRQLGAHADAKHENRDTEHRDDARQGSSKAQQVQEALPVRRSRGSSLALLPLGLLARTRRRLSTRRKLANQPNKEQDQDHFHQIVQPVPQRSPPLEDLPGLLLIRRAVRRAHRCAHEVVHAFRDRHQVHNQVCDGIHDDGEQDKPH